MKKFRDRYSILSFIAVLMLFGTPLLLAQLPQVVKESFDYAEGTVGGLGTAGDGWGGPWEAVTTGNAEVVEEDLGFNTIPTIGKVLQVFEAGTTFRNLADIWPDDGSTYWISMLYKRFDAIDVDNSYNGLSLFKGSAELLYIGKPWAGKNLGLEGSGVSPAVFSEIDAYDGGWMVIQLIMSGDSENDDAFLWINPDPAVQPDTATAPVHVKWKGSAGFDRLRIGSGNAPDQAECYYDEIRLSLTFAGLTTETTGGLPTPKSFYDFEETEGTAVIDQGSAVNHGEIVESSGMLVRSTGGIYAETGEGRGCLEFTEANAFGELCYVLIPFKDFMNSPNYTFSTWMQYIGTPNWGYLFWMGGDTWPEDPAERHVDVWLNPSEEGGGGVDCILNSEDGATLRVATTVAETGIGVMDGEWHQVTVTLTDGIIYRIYLDGIFAAEGEATAPIVENSGDDLYLGARPNDADAITSVKLVGLMDRVRLWDVALDDAQVETLFLMEGPNGGSLNVDDTPEAPCAFGLLSNYPNPFNPTTTLAYTLDKSEQVSLEIYDVLGHKIRTLYRGPQNAGRYDVQWNALDDNGQMVSSGLYIYRLQTSDRIQSGKMTLLK